jgi:DNA (cytosine-5)-methyltransferase 1
VIAPHEIIVDLFAGGGGASTGIFLATGRHPDIAVNHDADAIAVHTANHPTTRHEQASVWKVEPREACGGRAVGLLWASPDCRHFSRASGGRPRWKSVRSLPGVVVTWATRVRPRIIVVENVAEFQTWGPLLDDGTPCPDRIGRSFRAWCGRLRGLGYQVAWQEIVAADYGAPTIRKRLFVVARCDGEPIRWPAPTHSRRPSMFEAPWRSAAECIRWDVPAPSIFDRTRPLAEATCRRIAAGLRRFVLEAAHPFIITIDHQSNPNGVSGGDVPLSAITAKARHAIVQPFIAGVGGRMGQTEARDCARQPFQTLTTKADSVLVTPYTVSLTHHGGLRGQPMTEAMATITAANRGEKALVAPTLIQVGWGERDGQAPRAPGLDKPLGTVVAGGTKHAVVAAFLAQHNGGVIGRASREPLSTILTQGTQQQLVTAELAPQDAAGAERVAAFLVRYNGTNIGQDVREPIGALTTKPRFALVQVAGVPHAIVDIGMRMLLPEELAAAQGFPPDYRWARPDGAPVTKTTTIRLIGNSVSPPPAAALLRSLLETSTRKAAA